MRFEGLSPIKIGGLRVRVEDGTAELALQSLDGMWMGSKALIQIRTTLSPQVQAETLVHELVHAVSAVWLESRGLEEEEVASMAHGLFQLIVDNPHVMDEIRRCAAEET